MVSRRSKLRMRRILRKRRRQVEDIGYVTEEHIDKHLVRRITKLTSVRRFLIGWIGLIAILVVGVLMQSRALSNKYQVSVPVDGGIYTEGVLGSFTNANPLYASNLVDSSVSKLVFSSLFAYDENGQLTGDLAENYSYDPSETVYTVKLRQNVKWHDGKPFTSKDVLYTYSLIQNPETKSYLLSSWRGIKIKAVDDYTVQFTLPNKLSAFPHSLTNGIVPEHILSKVNPAQLRSNTFNNQSPVGTGPFSFVDIEVKQQGDNERISSVVLQKFENYHQGTPSLDKFILKAYSQEDQLINTYKDKQVDAIVGLNQLPDFLSNDDQTREYPITLTGQVMTFFKNDQEVLKDPTIRRALVLGVNKLELFSQVPYPLLAIDEPLLRSQPGYDKRYAQVTNKRDEAKVLLDGLGWKQDPSTGIRTKDGKKLTFRLFSGNDSELTAVSGALQKQWRELGVDVQVLLQSDSELQSTVATHSYDALLYGISIGPDPDVFAYWHSSQADPRSETRLNFSEYKSTVADRSLEAGRTRSDPANRAIKYRPFLEAWKNDNPALALYQTRFLYIARQPLYDFNSTLVATPSDRFANVDEWKVRSAAR